MPKSEDLSRSLEINAIWTLDTEFPTIFNINLCILQENWTTQYSKTLFISSSLMQKLHSICTMHVFVLNMSWWNILPRKGQRTGQVFQQSRIFWRHQRKVAFTWRCDTATSQGGSSGERQPRRWPVRGRWDPAKIMRILNIFRRLLTVCCIQWKHGTNASMEEEVGGRPLWVRVDNGNTIVFNRGLIPFTLRVMSVSLRSLNVLLTLFHSLSDRIASFYWSAALNTGFILVVGFRLSYRTCPCSPLRWHL